MEQVPAGGGRWWLGRRGLPPGRPSGWRPFDLRAARGAPWWGATTALVAASVALGLALGVPTLFSDPNGLDPHDLRLAAVSVLLFGATLVGRRLRPARPVLLAVAAIAVSFSAFSATPRVLGWLGAGGLRGTAQILIASVVQAAVTLGAVAVANRHLPAELLPPLRLRRFGWSAAAVTVAGIVLLVPIGIGIPAPLLGREGIAVPAVARDIGWLAPACALQAFAQELQFRGLLMGAVERVAPRAAANLAQAALFGVAHLAIQYPGPVGPFIPVTVAVGLVFGVMVQRTGSLWPAVLVHAVADIAITVTVLPGLYGY